MSRNTMLYNVYNDTVITKDTSLECIILSYLLFMSQCDTYEI